jgi:phage FluMu protein Com
MERALVREWVSTIQLVCPYCKCVQTESTPLHVIHSPPDYWTCEKCNKIMKVAAP